MIFYMSKKCHAMITIHLVYQAKCTALIYDKGEHSEAKKIYIRHLEEYQCLRHYCDLYECKDNARKDQSNDYENKCFIEALL